MIDAWNPYNEPVKNDLGTYVNSQKIPIGQGDDYTYGCLLDYLCFKRIIR